MLEVITAINPIAPPIVVTVVLLYLLYLFPLYMLLPLTLVYFYMFRSPTVIVDDSNRSVGDRSSGNRKYNKKLYPPPYPDAWYCVLYSHELPNKEHVKNVKIFNKDIAVYRGDNGQVYAIDAYCPHLGANMALGGKVIGCNLECPFHGWQFNGSGACTHIPYSPSFNSTTINSSTTNPSTTNSSTNTKDGTTNNRKQYIKTKSYTVKEINQQILIWFDCGDSGNNGDEEIKPYEVPVVTGLNDGYLHCYAEMKHYVNCHIQEIPENGADVHHLNVVHKPFFLSYMSCIKHYWQANWYVLPQPDDYVAKMELTHVITAFGTKLSLLDVSLNIYQVGPTLVYLVWTSKFGSGVLCQNLIPTGPLQQTIIHTNWTSNYVVGLFAKFFLYVEDIQLTRDIDIWNKKKYLSTPTLVKEDKLIKQYRSWYSKFYSTYSYDIADQNEQTLDW